MGSVADVAEHRSRRHAFVEPAQNLPDQAFRLGKRVDFEARQRLRIERLVAVVDERDDLYVLGHADSKPLHRQQTASRKIVVAEEHDIGTAAATETTSYRIIGALRETRRRKLGNVRVYDNILDRYPRLPERRQLPRRRNVRRDAQDAADSGAAAVRREIGERLAVRSPDVDPM